MGISRRLQPTLRAAFRFALPPWSDFATVAKIDREEPEMPSLDMLLAFAVTTAIFAFIPGPAMLYAAARTMATPPMSTFSTQSSKEAPERATSSNG